MNTYILAERADGSGEKHTERRAEKIKNGSKAESKNIVLKASIVTSLPVSAT